MKIGGSISYQLVDIFNIIDSNLPEQEKREKVSEYQKGLTSRDKETSIVMGAEGEYGSNIKNVSPRALATMDGTLSKAKEIEENEQSQGED